MKISKIKEPDFMQELHRIREKLSKKWSRLPSRELLADLSESSRWLKAQLRSSSAK